MAEALKIIVYPDPRLKKRSSDVADFTPLKDITDQMFALMREHKGVGLAAPQVGLNIRLFVMNATGEPTDDRVYVNPILSEADGEEEGEEGCLSIPELRVDIFRAKKLHMEARDLQGNPISESAEGYVARIWQHETDHLNGTLISDRMGAVAKIKHRGLLKDLEAKYKKKAAK